MTTRAPDLHRRTVLGLMAAAGAAAVLPAAALPAPAPLTRTIPSTGEEMPAVGLGTWITFNVGADPLALESSAAVMAAFFAAGGAMIDSSPMYGSSQDTVGYGLTRLGVPPQLYAAEKVWTSAAANGPPQIEESRRRWGVERLDLMQVHNLVNWQAHLPLLFAMKAEGRLRHVGITTSEGRRHPEFERIMASEPLDFVQVTYNPLDLEVERRILPMAQERGIGVIVNRPFRQGALTQALHGRPLPGWAAEIDCHSWAQVLLKFILAHPAVTCVIPATTRVDHVRENIAAAAMPLPDDAMRRRIAAAVRGL